MSGGVQTGVCRARLAQAGQTWPVAPL